MAATETFNKKLEEEKRFLNELKEKYTRQMDRLKSEEKTLRQLLRNSAIASTRHSLHHNECENTSDDVAHIDEEEWINQTPLELGQGGLTQQQSAITIPRTETNHDTGMASPKTDPTQLHSQMDAARSVVHSILQDELGPDWMHEDTS
ncbi:uncharacterized protein LOC134190661 [Corticium candelabrum]|uniref:uncharacterized protein LOC134190661 n=1 Tax=Corticium candelabrum TaxID=121492 RepID=UPI002E26A6B4|nr:uncharacterized protein LOC134190661 [Corticium candelabrum]